MIGTAHEEQLNIFFARTPGILSPYKPTHVQCAFLNKYGNAPTRRIEKHPNPSNAEATFVQNTRTQRKKKKLNPVMLVLIGEL